MFLILRTMLMPTSQRQAEDGKIPPQTACRPLISVSWFLISGLLVCPRLCLALSTSAAADSGSWSFWSRWRPAMVLQAGRRLRLGGACGRALLRERSG